MACGGHCSAAAALDLTTISWNLVEDTGRGNADVPLGDLGILRLAGGAGGRRRQPRRLRAGERAGVSRAGAALCCWQAIRRRSATECLSFAGGTKGLRRADR